MNRKLTLFISVIFLVYSFNIHAAEKFSCDELEASANELDDIADAFHATGEVREGDVVDNMLRDVVDSLYVYAAIEKEGDLTRHVGRLESAWQKMDGDKFASALEGVIRSFDRLLRRDCY